MKRKQRTKTTVRYSGTIDKTPKVFIISTFKSTCSTCRRSYHEHAHAHEHESRRSLLCSLCSLGQSRREAEGKKTVPNQTLIFFVRVFCSFTCVRSRFDPLLIGLRGGSASSPNSSLQANFIHSVESRIRSRHCILLLASLILSRQITEYAIIGIREQ